MPDMLNRRFFRGLISDMLLSEQVKLSIASTSKTTITILQELSK